MKIAISIPLEHRIPSDAVAHYGWRAVRQDHSVSRPRFQLKCRASHFVDFPVLHYQYGRTRIRTQHGPARLRPALPPMTNYPHQKTWTVTACRCPHSTSQTPTLLNNKKSHLEQLPRARHQDVRHLIPQAGQLRDVESHRGAQVEQPERQCGVWGCGVRDASRNMRPAHADTCWIYVKCRATDPSKAIAESRILARLHDKIQTVRYLNSKAKPLRHCRLAHVLQK